MSNEQPGTEMILTPRQEHLQTLSDNMEPGAKPAAIVPRTFAEAQQMCSALSRAGIVPASYQGKPENMMVVIMSGAEVGLPPMQALRLYHIIEGVPRLGAEGVRAIVLSSPQCEYFEFSVSSPTACTWIGKRPGRPEKSITWTIARAQQAGLAGRQTWQKSPEDMLNARASMQLGRLIWPEICAGMISREEASDGVIDAEFTEKPSFSAPPVPVGLGDVAPNPTMAAAAEVAAAAPRRGPGRPPKDKPADPTPPQASSDGVSGSAGKQKSSAERSVVDTSSSPAPAADPTPPGSASESQASTGSGSSSTTESSTGNDSVPDEDDEAIARQSDEDGFGNEYAAEDEAERKLNEFFAWLLTQKSQAQLRKESAPWHAWVAEGEKTKDMRFAVGGKIVMAMSQAYAKRKSELPK